MTYQQIVTTPQIKLEELHVNKRGDMYQTSYTFPHLSSVGLDLSVGIGVNFEWSVFVQLGWRGGVLSQLSLSKKPICGSINNSISMSMDQAQGAHSDHTNSDHTDSDHTDSDHAACVTPYAQWYTHTRRLSLGGQYRPFDWLSPVFSAQMGAALREMYLGYEVLRQDPLQTDSNQELTRGRALTDFIEWTLFVRGLIGAEWRWASHWGLGAGLYLEYENEAHYGCTIWISTYRYIRGW